MLTSVDDLPGKPGMFIKLFFQSLKLTTMTDKNPETINNKISDEQKEQLARERELLLKVKNSLINSLKNKKPCTEDIKFLLKRL